MRSFLRERHISGQPVPPWSYSPVQAPFPQLMATRSAPLFTVRVVFAPVKLMSCRNRPPVRLHYYRGERATYGDGDARARRAEGVGVALPAA